MKVGVVVFPGSNCDHDMLHVASEILQLEARELWHKHSDLGGLTEDDLIVLPGGFSYGDYLRAGAIARFSPIMQSVVEFAGAGGMVMGICNGFQILCETKLLPGVLLRNSAQRFICKNVWLKPVSKMAPPSMHLDADRSYKIPIAHADGRYYCDEATRADMVKHDQILFRYCDAKGMISDDSNPNGSVDHIAGVANRSMNVFGMMPHPERAADRALLNVDGLAIFRSILDSKSVMI